MPFADEMGIPKGRNCALCGGASPPVTAALGVCLNCLLEKSSAARPYVQAAHVASRAQFDLPIEPPRHPGGIRCPLCSNECVIGEGERGFCGLRIIRKGRLVHLAGTPGRGLLQWYRDPLPTNCVAAWVCEGSRRPGYHNLAVFYQSCTSDCLFCQNWHFRDTPIARTDTVTADQLASAANSRTFCVCFFGGDPGSQLPHALAAARYLAERGVRICWETNGMMHSRLLDRAVEHSIRTGGCIKFDLKAFNENLHRALTGVSNQRTLENFARIARLHSERPESPLVTASTLLVPDYIDAGQVGKIAAFIAAINPQIPYSLLAFYPTFYMTDLPCTSARQAREAEAAARRAGLVNVHIGNRHLLEPDGD